MGSTGAEFCIFSIAKGGGKLMHINQSFLFVDEGTVRCSLNVGQLHEVKC